MATPRVRTRRSVGVPRDRTQRLVRSPLTILPSETGHPRHGSASLIGQRRGNFRTSEAAQRSAERRRREDEAPRLKAEVPNLEKLDFTISDSKGVADPTSTHVRRIVIAHAAALFEIPCSDPGCKDGGHDLTDRIMRALRAHQTSFDGEDVCRGNVGSSECGRVLRYVATASFTGV